MSNPTNFDERLDEIINHDYDSEALDLLDARTREFAYSTSWAGELLNEKTKFLLKSAIKQAVLDLIGNDEDRYHRLNTNWRTEIDARNMFRSELRALLGKEY